MKKIFSPLIVITLFGLLAISAVNAQEKTLPEGKPQFSEVSVQNFTVTKPDDKKSKKKKKRGSEIAESGPAPLLPVLAYDSKNELIRNLSAADLALFVNGKERRIESFRSFGEGMNVVLMFDNSNSASVNRDGIKNLFGRFIDLIRPQDNLFVVSYDDRVKLLADDGIGRGEAKRKLEKLSSGGGTSLYDAIGQTLTEIVKTADKPTAVFLLTDGVDTTSRKYSFMEILKTVERSNTIFSVIYHDTFKEMADSAANIKNDPRLDALLRQTFGNRPLRVGNRPVAGRGMTAEEYKLGVDFLNGLVSLSGGRAIKTESSTEEYKKAFEFIYDEMKNAVLVGFEPVSENVDDVKIRLNKPDIFIRTKNKLAFEERR